MNGKVGWIDSELFDGHTNGFGHPECPERLKAVRERFEGEGLAGKLERTAPSAVDRRLLESLHDPAYVARVEATCEQGGGRLDPDTSVVPASWEASLLAAGAVVDAVKRVLDGDWARAFCSVRPPGHHARPASGMGFCLFDNVAVAAQAALDSGIERVAILDWDVHHGNGTQELFWSRGDVLFASWHQYPFYPGSGAADEVGVGEGEGLTVNCPVASGGGDADYMKGWEERIRPALEEFGPGLVLISAGFDADARDPLASLRCTPAGYEALSSAVVAWADAHCGGKVVSVLEGGYHLDALAEDAQRHVETYF